MALRPTSTRRKRGRKKGNGEYRGIRFRKDRWISEIRVPKMKKRIWLGSHLSAERAARAYDAALYCLKGENGIFNFPKNKKPDLSSGKIGQLTYKEIKCIVKRFSTLEESVERPALSPPRELSPLREVPHLIKSPIMPNWEINNQFCAKKIDVPQLTTSSAIENSEMNSQFCAKKIDVFELVKSPVISSSEKSFQFCENSTDTSEESYKLTFAPEEVPYDPSIVLDGEYLAEQFSELDQWGLLDEGWMRYSKNAMLKK